MPTMMFADLDALRLVLAGGGVGADVSAAPAFAGFDSQGRLWLHTEIPLSRAGTAALSRLGIPILADGADAELSSISCWFEVFAPKPVEIPVTITTPALFVLPARRIAVTVAEVKRLSPNSEVEIHIPDSGDEAWLRVRPCPAFTLLAAPNATAFLEQKPRVWVEGGYEHPLGHLADPPLGRIALVGASGQWSWRPEPSFVAEIAAFDLPRAASRHGDSALTDKLEMSLRLLAGGADEPPELWLIQDRPFEQLERLARQAGQDFIERFRWAVIDSSGTPTIALWANQAKAGPPAAMIDGLGFRPYLKLSQLLVPCGYRLRPPLRRDAVRRLCDEQPGRLTLLLPGSHGEFSLVRIPESIFEPLGAGIDFLIEAEQQALEPIAFGPILDWLPFRLQEPPAKPPALPAAAPRTNEPALATKKPGLLARLRNWRRPARNQANAGEAEALRGDPPTAAGRTPGEVPGRISELLIRRTKLEMRYLKAMHATDPAQRIALLPELAAANAQLGHLTDAAACWLTAIWQHPAPPRYWLWGWLQVEKKLGRAAYEERDLRLLVEAAPAPATVRTLAASVVWLAGQETPPAELRECAGRIRHVLEAHERWLPMRAAWLAQLSLNKAAGPDLLSLARARDRLSERLFQHGLSMELDLPSFLRFAGRSAGERLPAVRDWLLRLRDSAHRWIESQVRQRPADYLAKQVEGYPDQDGGGTKALADLMLAWGLARLGEASAARRLAQPARDVLSRFADPVYDFLERAFDARIGQALDGNPGHGPLPNELIEQLERFTPTADDDRPVVARYRIDSLRQHSRILEPTEPVNAYLGAAPRLFQSEWIRTIENSEQIGAFIDRLLRMPRTAFDRAEMLSTALALIPKLGAPFAREFLARFGVIVSRVDAPLSRLLLTGDAIAAASFFELDDAGRGLIDMLLSLFQDDQCRFPRLALHLLQSLASDRHHGPDDLQRLEALPGQCLRAVRQLGLHHELDRLRTGAIDWILHGEPLRNLRRTQPVTWLQALRAMLHLSGGWSGPRDDEQAALLLDAARQCLLYTDIPSSDKGPLARAYAAALGQAPIRVAQGRVEEMFRDLTGLHDLRQTNTHFALTPLRLIDAVVRALVADEFVLGPGIRRWLADDEFLVRRRMQQDLHALAADPAS